LAALAMAGGAVAIVLAFAPRWMSPPPDPAEEDEAEEEILGPAFSPGATAADLKQSALDVGEELVRGLPGRPEALNVRGWIRSNLGYTAEAIEDLERCVRLDPRFVDPLMSLATIARQKGEYDRAEGFLRRVREISPGDPHPAIVLGEVLIAKGQARQAAELLEAIRGLASDPVAVLSPLGHAYLQLEEHAKARDALEQVVAGAPDAKNAWYALGKASAALGDHARAKECMARFRALTAEDQKKNTGRIRALDDLAEMRRIAAEAHHEAGKVHLKCGEADAAERLWRRAAAADPKHVECRMALAALYERTDRPAKALRIGAEICRMRPERPESWFYVGLLNARLGRVDDAREALEKAVERDPKNPKYREVYEAVRKAG
jgi:tetratricopeptide (TPR) repeat protein